MDDQTCRLLVHRIRQKQERECFDEEYLLDLLQVWNEGVRPQSMRELAEKYATALSKFPLEWEEHMSRSQTDYLAWDAIQVLLDKERPFLANLLPPPPQFLVPYARLQSWALDVALGIRPRPPAPRGGDDRVLRTRNAMIVVTLKRLQDMGTPLSTSNESAREGTGFQLVGDRLRRKYEGVRDVWKKNKWLLDEPDTVRLYETTIGGPVALFCLTFVLGGDLEGIERIVQAGQSWRRFSEWFFQSTRSPS